tara:strand:- start:313 stop:873 length:561 start_codon:yes stop_codon:yes gene_type:complete
MRYIICSLAIVIATSVVAQDLPKSYPITFRADDVYLFADFSVESNGLKLTGKDIAIVPIRCDAGITGAMVIGNGTYSYAVPSNADQESGKFRAAMLRFNPKDQPSLMPLDGDKATTDHAVHEMGRHMLDNVFRHCWHSGMKAIFPDADSFVANVYSTTKGDLLISTGPKSNVVHSFTAKQTLAKNP